MSHENRGLQVALIVFATLTVALAATTWNFFSRGQELAIQSRTAKAEAARTAADSQLQQREAAELRRLIGLPDAPLALIESQLDEHAATAPETERTYHRAMRHFCERASAKDAELSAAREAAERWKDRYARLEAAKQSQVALHTDNAASARVETVRIDRNAGETIARQRAELDILARALSDEKQRAADAQSRFQKDVDAVRAELRTANVQIEALKEHIAGLNRRENLQAHGRVVNVSQRLKAAWIDLGRADALPPLTGFDVYAEAAAALGSSSRKGKVEVTKVTGDHLAQASIADENPRAPIVPGDKIHSKLWRPAAR